ncbi:MAG: DUF1573 domain-containing protein [Candidatus Gracilibacteria bacterium]
MNNLIRNLVIFGIVVAGVVAIVMVSSGGNSGPESSASVLQALETDFDFQTISMGNGIVKHEYELKNDGETAVEIQKVSTSCMCTEAYVVADGEEYGPYGMSAHGGASAAGILVKPSETVTVRAEFDPAAHGPAGVGMAERVIYVETNSTQSPRMELKFKATVTP